jgi:uncharacterized protein YijF (DUF1287 family)
MPGGMIEDTSTDAPSDTGATFSRRGLLLGMALAVPAGVLATVPPRRAAGALIVAARRQVGVTLSYDPGYTTLAFPGGDVPRGKGVCTDVLVRAYRDAFGLDLQALVNADMRANFSAYPRRWGLARPDRSIDHRRVPNLATFFARRQARLPVPAEPDGWRPGDIFTSMVGGRLPHIGIVSAGPPGTVIHNIGRGAREEVALFDHMLTGRYRWALDS